MSQLSLTKKIVFSSVCFIGFVVASELVLRLAPMIMGFGQRGQFDRILDGGSTIVCMGDSVTYGYGVSKGESYPARLQEILTNNGGNKIQVINHGTSGDTSRDVLLDAAVVLPRITAANSRPVVLYLAGHNDLMGVGWQKWSSRKKPADSPENELQMPRLLRVFSWIWDQQSITQNAVQLDPQSVKEFKANMIRVWRKIKKHNGQVYLMTYMLPGDANDIRDPETQKHIRKGRQYQGKANQIIRTFAKQKELPLIDLERTVQVPNKWDTSWFQDHIHPTAHGYQAMADAVLKHLVAYGELPINLTTK